MSDRLGSGRVAGRGGAGIRGHALAMPGCGGAMGKGCHRFAVPGGSRLDVPWVIHPPGGAMDTQDRKPQGPGAPPEKPAFDRAHFLSEVRRLQAEIPVRKVDTTALLREDRSR